MKLLRRKFCECGCGQVVGKGKRFIYNHHLKGREFSEESKERRRIATTKRYKNNPEERRKTGELSRKYWSTPESREKASKSSIEINSRPEVKEIRRQHMLDRYKDPREREKTSELSKKYWAEPKSKKEMSERVLKQWSNPEFREKTIIAQKEGYNKPGVREKLSRRSLKRWSNPEFIEKMNILWNDPNHIKKVIKAGGMKPNKAEKKLNNIIQKLFPKEYKLNVKANIMTIGRKVPDFVNVNGKKKLIELWGNYWHRGQDPNNRIDYFKQFGWNTLVVWEKELKKESLLKARLINFHEKGIDSCLLRR